MAYRLAFNNKKGGVGKTSLTANVAAGLASLGYDVLMVDADPQGHIARCFKLFVDGAAPDLLFPVFAGYINIYDALIPVKPERYVQRVPSDLRSLQVKDTPGRLEALLGSVNTTMIPQFARNNNSNMGLLSQMLAKVDEDFDFILIDTPPTDSEATPLILSAANGLIIPTEPEELSVAMIASVYASMENLKGLHRAEVIGIVPTMVRNGLELHDIYLDQITTAYQSLVWNDCAISQSSDWSRAVTFGQSVMREAPYNNSAKEAWQLTKTVAQQVLERV